MNESCIEKMLRISQMDNNYTKNILGKDERKWKSI